MHSVLWTNKILFQDLLGVCTNRHISLINNPRSFSGAIITMAHDMQDENNTSGETRKKT
jgi:hypothetical protein